MDAFREGGFMMWPILGAGLVVLATAVAEGRKLVFGSGGRWPTANAEVVLAWGGFAAVIGVLGTLIGIVQAARAIEAAGHVESSLLWGGIKVTLITSIFGLLVFAASLLIWFGLHAIRSRRHRSVEDPA
jgi:biopolymer transport protein ExbB/TolQ